MNKFKTVVFIFVLSVLMLVGCKKTEDVDSSVKDNIDASMTDNTDSNDDNKNEDDTDTDPVDKNDFAVYEAYKKLLNEFVQNGVLPGENGEIKAEDSYKEQCIAESKFAVVDVDNDGVDELIVYYYGSSMAGMLGIIYDYIDGNVCYKFATFPALSFYKNGAIEAGWSHNQGWAGEFWPYTLYAYDLETDSYTCVGNVDAYDKQLYESCKDSFDAMGKSFPSDIDKDGNGFVYYIYGPEIENYQEIDPVDDDDLEAWLKNYTDGTEKFVPEFLSFNEENINNIGVN